MISDWLKVHQEDISNGKIRVLAVDECHVQAGDICGYGWGDRITRREVIVDNYRDSQTYYGTLDCISGEVLLKFFQTANSASTIEFVKHLQAQSPETKLVLVWDSCQLPPLSSVSQFSGSN